MRREKEVIEKNRVEFQDMMETMQKRMKILSTLQKEIFHKKKMFRSENFILSQ